MKHKFLKFAAFTAATMIIINEYITTKTELLDRLDKNDDGQTYKWRYGNIYYTKTGIGSPILLLHDLTPGSSAEEWKSTIETLSETHTVYAIDLLGCGR
ncbi:MAG: alpha/beta hydrolase, partial [Clostridiales bacterium]|nr:alpha/beta hydrolase [Candidatus Blautia equi]